MQSYINTISNNLSSEDRVVLIYQGIIASGSLVLKEAFLAYIKDRINSTYYNYFQDEVTPPSLPESYVKSCDTLKKVFITPNCINAVHIALSLSKEENLLDYLELFGAGFMLGKYILTLNMKLKDKLDTTLPFPSYILSALCKKEEFVVDF